MIEVIVMPADAAPPPKSSFQVKQFESGAGLGVLLQYCRDGSPVFTTLMTPEQAILLGDALQFEAKS